MMADKPLQSASVSTVTSKCNYSSSGYLTKGPCIVKVEGQGQRTTRRLRRFVSLPPTFVQVSDNSNNCTSSKYDGCAKNVDLFVPGADYADDKYSSPVRSAAPAPTIDASYIDSCSYMLDDSRAYIVTPAFKKEDPTFVIPKYVLQSSAQRISLTDSLGLSASTQKVRVLPKEAFRSPASIRSTSSSVLRAHYVPFTHATKVSDTDPLYQYEMTDISSEVRAGCSHEKMIPLPTLSGPPAARKKKQITELQKKTQSPFFHRLTLPQVNTHILVADRARSKDEHLQPQALQTLQRVQVKAAQSSPGRKSPREGVDLKRAHVFAVPRLPVAKVKSTRKNSAKKNSVSPYRFPANIFDADDRVTDREDDLSPFLFFPRSPAHGAYTKRLRIQPKPVLASSVPVAFLRPSPNLDDDPTKSATTEVRRYSTAQQTLQAKIILVSRQTPSSVESGAASQAVRKDAQTLAAELRNASHVTNLKTWRDTESDETLQPAPPSLSEKCQTGGGPTAARNPGVRRGPEVAGVARRARALEEHVKRIYSLKQVTSFSD